MAINADKFLGDLRTRYRASPVPGFLAWWWSELKTLVPPGLRTRLVAPRPQLLLVSKGESGLEAWEGGLVPVRMAAWESLDDARAIRARLLEIQSGYTDGAPEIRLCLPADQVLECQAQLPLAVEGNLTQALRYQLDQITPFRAEQVWYDYRVAGRDSASGKLSIDLRLVPRDELDTILKRLSALGLRPHAVDITESGNPKPQGFNLIPEHQRPRYVHKRARINLLLALAVVGVLALVMAQSLFMRERGLTQLRAEADRQRAEARAVTELKSELDDALLAANFLAERRRRVPVAIDILAEVTDLVPEENWVQQFRINGRELNLVGLAVASEQLIELLDESPLLESSEFRTETRIDPNTNMERFNLSSRILTVIMEDEDDETSS